jgi:uncharacterized membrane protein
LGKTITYRFIVTTLDFSWNYVLLGETATAAGLTAISFAAGPVFYLVHEAAWHVFGPSVMRKIALRLASPDPSASKNAWRGRFSVDRAVAKAITFRTFATTMEFTTNYIVVRDVAMATALSAFGFVFGPFIYLGHERAWDYYRAHREGILIPRDAMGALTTGFTERDTSGGATIFREEGVGIDRVNPEPTAKSGR